MAKPTQDFERLPEGRYPKLSTPVSNGSRDMLRGEASLHIPHPASLTLLFPPDDTYDDARIM